MDNDLISRAAAIAALTDANLRKNVDSVCDGDMNRTRRAAQRVIAQLPAVDAVPVVRCKDCKNWDSSTEGRYVGGWCFCEKLQFSTSPDWFCADGERVDAPTCGPDYCEIGGGDDES